MLLDIQQGGTRRTLQDVLDLQGLLLSMMQQESSNAGSGDSGQQHSQPRAPPPLWLQQLVPRVTRAKLLERWCAKCLVLIGPKSISSLTFLFSAPNCGATTAGTRSGGVDGGDDGQQQRQQLMHVMSTVAHYFDTCSHGRMKLPAERNLVLGPISLPACSGVAPTKGAYDLASGRGNGVNLDGELYGLWDLAKEWMRKNRPDLFAARLLYNRQTLLFPLGQLNASDPAAVSGAYSLGRAASGVVSVRNMGCPGPDDFIPSAISPADCLNWVSPAAPPSPVADAVALIRSHLLNNGFAHPTASRLVCGDAGGSDSSSCRTEPYGDPSDPMGPAEPVNAAGNVVCPAAPQSYLTDWAAQIEELKGTPAAGEGFVPYEVPSMHTAETNFLRIAISQNSVQLAGSRRKRERAVFVSYRVASPTPGGYDSGLPASLSGRVWVHEYNQTADGLPVDPNMPPVLLAMLEVAGPTFALPDAFGARDALYIRFVSKSNTTATVELCRTMPAVESVDDGTCNDGLDNDCDDLADADDPDCR
ncbi:hypothetical protein HXX76_002901 [Chlamydomonas incerta]|uniref:Peptidase M11 gametolysin domain-containing protein n=1 Tax=Chlamydomonas incerta TaxID=51695 RepID=A0A835TC95_CHLIN|nr:hypothetical protein HXX76_002901 [Chlamydomonas incerta]|eukprot:KAG2442822.1 hypothetical protein HXX76_002901 [Chlamydomonas incerta]